MAKVVFSFVSRSRRGALIDEDYRYALWRTWSAGPAVLFIGLNPSVADAQSDDPTIRRCIRFAMDWGFGTLYMGNLFAYRTTWPEYLKKAADPVGPGNEAALAWMSGECSLVVAAWGVHGAFLGRGEAVCRAFRDRGTPLHVLGLTKDGSPKHPLYLPAAIRPVLWRS